MDQTDGIDPCRVIALTIALAILVECRWFSWKSQLFVRVFCQIEDEFSYFERRRISSEFTLFPKITFYPKIVKCIQLPIKLQDNVPFPSTHTTSCVSIPPWTDSATIPTEWCPMRVC